MPSFKLEFHVKARKEWDKLDATIRLQFAKKLKERLTSPRIEADKLSGMTDCYKIKLRSAGYRLVYQVFDNKLVITVVAVGKRERSEAYAVAQKRVEQS